MCIGNHSGRLRIGLVGVPRREGRAGRRRAVVVGDGVVDHEHLGRILQGYAARRQAGYIVHDHVVEHQYLVPGRVVGRRNEHILAVDAAQQHAAAVARSCVVALNQVRDDRDRAGSRRLLDRRADRLRQTCDEKTTARAGTAGATAGRLLEALVEQNLIIGNQAVGTEPIVGDTPTVAQRVVPADVVVCDLVVITAGVECNTGSRREQRAVLADVVVMNRHVVVLGARVGAVVPVREVRVAQADTAAVEALVVHDMVIADLEVPGIPVDYDAGRLIGAGDGESIDTGRDGVAESPLFRRHEDPRSFLCFEQPGAGIKAARAGRQRQVVALTREQVNLRWCAVGQGIHLLPPELQILGGASDCVDLGRRRAPALQFDRLGHDEHLEVGSGRHEDQIARLRHIEHILDLGVRGYCSDFSGIVPDMDGDGVGRRLAAIGSSDHQLAGLRVRRHRACNQAIRPRHVLKRHPADRYSAGRGPEAKVPSDELRVLAIDTDRVGIRHLNCADRRD